jgi:carbamoyl-phosphate synthase large subunit
MAADEAVAVAEELGYPVLVRPSYVLGGRAMEVVENTQDLVGYMASAVKVSSKHPVLIDKYIRGKEVEVDAVCDGHQTLIPAIIEHIERAGVHSGDSTAVIPAQTLTAGEAQQIVSYTMRIAVALRIKGLLNIQYVIANGRAYCLEVNPRASRTVPVLSKVTGIPLVKLATRIMLGSTLADLGYGAGLAPPPPFVAVKAPVFSFEKLTRVDVSLGPEMKSTGEVLGIDPDYGMALYKALLAAGINVPLGGRVLVSLAERDRAEAIPILAGYAELGFEILATGDSAQELRAGGIEHRVVVSTAPCPKEMAGTRLRAREGLSKDGLAPALDLIRDGQVQLVINTPTRGRIPERAGFIMRRTATEYGVPCLTSLDTAAALLDVLRARKDGARSTCCCLQEYLNLPRTLTEDAQPSGQSV